MKDGELKLLRDALDAARICLKNRDQSPLEMQALEKVKAALAWLDSLPRSDGNNGSN